VKHTTYILFFIILGACVDRLNENVGQGIQPYLIVEGLLTNEPGPYRIRLSKAYDLYSNLRSRTPFVAKEVSLTDGEGAVHFLSERLEGFGSFWTDSSFSTVIGNSYKLRIVDRVGNIFESNMEVLRPPAEIDSMYFEFFQQDQINAPTVSGFRVMINTVLPAGNRYRWRYEGTYKIKTNPELKTRPNPEDPSSPIPDPPECSGLTWASGVVTRHGDCGCCTCWISEFDDKPLAETPERFFGGRVVNRQVASIPINERTFLDKFRVELRQLTISEEAYRFWDVIGKQKDAAEDLFQPVGGAVPSNIVHVNGDLPVLGLFYVAGVSKKVTYLTRDNLPRGFRVDDPPLVKEACTIFNNSTWFRPEFWVD